MQRSPKELMQIIWAWELAVNCCSRLNNRLLLWPVTKVYWRPSNKRHREHSRVAGFSCCQHQKREPRPLLISCWTVRVSQTYHSLHCSKLCLLQNLHHISQPLCTVCLKTTYVAVCGELLWLFSCCQHEIQCSWHTQTYIEYPNIYSLFGGLCVCLYITGGYCTCINLLLVSTV